MHKTARGFAWICKLSEPLYAAEAKRRQGERTDLLQNFVKSEPVHTAERIANVAGVSRENIRKVKKIEAEGMTHWV